LRLAAVGFFNGDYDRALEHYEAALALAQEAGLQRNVGLAEIGLAEVCFAKDRFEESMEHARKGLAIAKEIGEKSLQLKASIMEATVTARTGLANMGIDRLRRLIGEVNQFGDEELTIYSKIRLGQVLQSSASNPRHGEEARELLKEARAMSERHELKTMIRMVDEIAGPSDDN